MWKAIVQPAIKMDCGPDDSIFMHLEAMRQRVYEPMNNTMTTLLGKSAAFGFLNFPTQWYLQQGLAAIGNKCI